MTLEHKINLIPANGLEAKLRPSPRRSLAVRVITYSLAAFLSFVAAYGLSGCNDSDYTPNKYSYAIGLDNCGKKSTFYKDADHDGYGNAAITTQACSQPYGYVTNNTDCGDNNSNVNPGIIEIPYNGLDDDCNSTTLDDDLDQDGYSTLTGTIDCNDSNADVYPNAPELCDLIDNQCPGDVGHWMVDEGCLPSGLTGKIAFVSGNDIHIINANGSNQTNLTNTPGFYEDNITWSPDGSKIAFGSVSAPGHHGNLWEINVINSDGSNNRQVSHVGDYYAVEYNGLKPAWFPDGSKIVFYSYPWPTSSVFGIYTVNVDGSGQTLLSNKYFDSDYPPIAWSPDGSKLATTQFVCPAGRCNPEICVMNADGSNPTNLTNNLARDINPSWSPDGSEIAFSSNRDGNNEIYAINADGTDLTNLTNNPANDVRPRWSPDGTKIFFYRWNDPLPGMYTMNPDGTDQTFLADGEYPSWSPDGTEIAFVSGRGGNREIYVMYANGNNQTNITNNLLINVEYPVWSP